MRVTPRLLMFGLLTSSLLSAAATPATAAPAGNAETPLVEGFEYPLQEAIPGITLSRGNGRIQLVDCANGGAGLLRVRSSVREEEFCFDVKGPGGYLALELRQTYQLRGDDQNHVEATVTVNNVEQPEVTVPDRSWVTLPVKAGDGGNTLVELRSKDEAPANNAAPAGPVPFAAKVNVGDPADGGRSCSAVLVHPSWVMTTKQCLAGALTPEGALQRATTVTVGRADVSGSGPGYVGSAGAVVQHPDRDVVLVRARFEAGVKPVTVPDAPVGLDGTLEAVGFGRTASTWVPDQAHSTDVTVTPATDTTLQVAGTAPEATFCQGDAGGPVLRRTGDRVDVVALLDAGGQKGCLAAAADATAGAVATRVDGLGDWVRRSISEVSLLGVHGVDGGRFTERDGLIGVSELSGKLWLYPGSPTPGVLDMPIMMGTGGWNGMAEVTVGDFTGDGKDDVAAVEKSTGKLWMYPGVAGPALGSRVLMGSGGWNGMAELIAGDFTGDGKDDVAAVEKSTGKLWLYPRTGSAVLGSRVVMGTGGWNGMKHLTAGDYNGDGRADVVAVETSSGKLWLYPRTTASGVLGARVLKGSGGWNDAWEIAPGDFNYDGHADLYVELHHSLPSGQIGSPPLPQSLLYPGPNLSGPVTLRMLPSNVDN
ncbi:FG-GAP-like repeat-containing protein [Actinoplanes oblitus]|uniref:FG-GAP-like repeat-containing protein n=1 Tax=Actinoplanes oblitus TaxID=3040509 RepID=A0ABY8WGI4_9ACTN|nr:FG-GAP-like repeat-containing protein [Actinoplanes oblitus]WIM96181.1 FG-GAP-like repeat-containing protein [Actinoplanes oblitus]